MRFIKYLSVIIVLLCLCCACSKGGERLEVKLSPSEKTLVDLVTETYSDTQLLEITQFSGKINELNKQYPIECVRKIENTYRVSYLGDYSVAVIVFDKSGNRILGNVYSMLQSKSVFSSLTKGQSLEEVKEIDPKGEYLFLHTGRNDAPKISTHYTKDGYLITIEYDTTNTILNIMEEMI